MSLHNQIHEIEHIMNSGDMKEAITRLNDLLNEHPKNYHLISLLGECYLSSGQPEKAIKPLLWSTKNYPKDKSELECPEEEELGELNEFDAEEDFDITNEDDEDVLIDQLRTEEPLSESGGSWVDHYLLGCAYGRCMQFRQGIKQLEIANQLNPDHSEIVRNIGWIQCMNKQPIKGRKNLMRAITIDKKNALAYNDMGASYLFDGNIEEAKKWIDKAVSLDPSDPFIKTTADKLDELKALKILFNENRKASPREFLNE